MVDDQSPAKKVFRQPDKEGNDDQVRKIAGTGSDNPPR